MSYSDTKVRAEIAKSDETIPLLKVPKVRLMSGKEREEIMVTQAAIINQFKPMALDIETIFTTDNENTQTIFEFVETLDEYIKKQASILEAEKKEKEATKIETQKRDRVGYAIGTLSATTATAATAALHLPVDAVLNSGSGAMTIGIGLGRAHQEMIELYNYIISCLPSSCVAKCSSNEKSQPEFNAINSNKKIDAKINAESLNDVKVKNDVTVQSSPKKTKLKPLKRIPKSQEVYIGNTVDLIQKQFENNQEMIALIEGKKEQLKTITDYIAQQMDIITKQKFALEAEAKARKSEAADKIERERIGYLCGVGLGVTALIGTAAASVPIAGVISSAGGAMTFGIGFGRGFHRAITKCCTCIGNQSCCCKTKIEITPPPSPQMDRQDTNIAAIPILKTPATAAKAVPAQSFQAAIVNPPNIVVNTIQATTRLTSPSIITRPVTPLSDARTGVSTIVIDINQIDVNSHTSSARGLILSPSSSMGSNSPTPSSPSTPTVLANNPAAGAPQIISTAVKPTPPIIKRNKTLSLAPIGSSARYSASSLNAGATSTVTRGRSATGSAAPNSPAATSSGTTKVTGSSRVRSATPKGLTKPSTSSTRR